MVRSHSQERESVTEDAIWSDILANLGTHPEERPSAQAIQAVLQRVERIERRIARSSGETPTREKLLQSEKRAQRLIEDAIAAVAYNGIEVSGTLVVAPPHEVRASVTAALNRYPRTDSLMARYVLPILRRELKPPPGPGWYFALMEDFRQTKRTRPFLFPRGGKAPRGMSLSSNYGWHRLELWTLTAYLAMEEDLLHGTSTYCHDRERLEALVEYAARRLRALTNAPSVHGRLMEFEELCSSLRRFLIWNTTNALAPIDSRRLCRRFLDRLGRSILPSLPNKSPADVRWYHKEAYQRILRELKRIWKETRGDRSPKHREALIIEAFPPLDPRLDKAIHHRHRPGNLPNFRDEVWKACGDLLEPEPNLIAKRLVRVFFRLRLAPQALKVALGRVPDVPTHLAADSLPYAVQSSKKSGDAAERNTKVVPIEFV